MSATDELRRLLDERGVEWRKTPHYSSESQDNETIFEGNGIEWYANDHLNGRLGLRTARYEVTPAQAIAATLGAGTCHAIISDNLTESEGMGDAWADCSECGHLLFVLTDLNSEPPNFCPNCGRRVVEVTS